MVRQRTLLLAGAALVLLASVWPTSPLSGAERRGQTPAANGKVIFEKTAGGVGCAACHGLDGRGKRDLASPNIRGKAVSDILRALETRAQMRFINLSDDELEAVAAYLKALNGQP
jgi:mono/diheme cytochrome c family protein